MRFIILTESDAMRVRCASLQPRAVDDFFILPLAVLADPLHADHHAFLSQLPQEELELVQGDGEV